MARPFPSIRKPSAGWTGAVNYTLEDHIASPYPHPIYPRKDGVLPNDSITRHMADAGAHRKYFLSTSELIFTKAEYEANKTRDGATITDPTTRESSLYQYLITAPALAAILADYNSSGGLGYESLVKEILGAPGSHTYTMCTAEDDIKAPSIGLFVELFDKFNAVVGILPSQSKPTLETPTALTKVFAFKNHYHDKYESRGISHNEIWAAINAGGGGGSGGMGGVIDGTLCTDAATGQPCVTEIELHDGTTPNNQTSYTYTVQHSCLLFIQLKNAIIADNGSASVPRDCILVKAGEQVIGTLTDNLQDLWNDLDNDGLRIPVKAGTTITLVGDGTTPIFDGTSLTTDSKIVFSEFELTPLSMRIGLPNYDTPTDITDNVSRTSDTDESKNYHAAADGFVLFEFNTEKYQQSLNFRADGVVAGVNVFHSFYYAVASDASVGSGVVPVRKGDEIDLRLTADLAGTTCINNANYVKVTFYPLVGAEHTEGEGPIEYPVIEHAFTNTDNNPFIGTATPSATDLTITSAKIENLCGRSNIDLSTCNISLKIDVFTPKKNGSTVVVDGNGFAEIDKTHPVYRNEAIVYCDADNSPAGYYNDYSRHLDVSIVGGAAKIAWTEAFKKDPAANSVAASFPLPALSSLLEANAGKIAWDDFNNSYGKFIDVASDLGLSDCYIRLTAVIDPCTKIIKQTISKAGMFIDGEINNDDNGNVCRTPVTNSDFVDSGSTTEDRYVYTYTTKTDCWLYATVKLSVSSSSDYMTILINGVKLSRFSETPISSVAAEPVKTLSLAVKKGTDITFRFSAKPTETDIIDITEFKMSTELTPAKFPSLAVRICDVDCYEEYTGQDSGGTVVPRALPSTTSTGAYVSWTETQFRNIFGSAFDFEHAKFDVTAVFYVGNSANDYDSATNKLEDTGIEVSLSNQGQQIRPFVVTDIVNGERVAKLSLPGIAYFCSNVAYDTTDGFKLVPRTDGAHISIGDGGNNLIGDFSSHGKKIRMRLLLHVSDRRGEMADGGRIPNGISPNSKMVRQSDMNMNVSVSGVYPTYSNEITITESGHCIVMSNIDSDGQGYATTVQALIGGVWRNISSGCVVSTAPSQGVQSYSFPVEAGLKLRMATNTVIDGTDFNTAWNADNTGGTARSPYDFFTRMKQACCWVIPTSKYLAPEYTLPGSAGVIDGSIWKDENGNDLVTNITPNKVDKEITYDVKNDCYLMIALYNTDIGDGVGSDGRECIDIFVNGVVAGCLSELNQNSGGLESGVCGINVARGSVVKLLHHHNNGANTYALFGSVASDNSNPKLNGLLTFTEFKLRATNVVAAMPDWNTSKSHTVSDGDTIQADGWIVVEYDGVSSSDGLAKIKINGAVVSHGIGSANGLSCSTVTIPVSKGDVVTIDASTGHIPVTMTFYPVKMHEVRTTSASAIEVIAMSSRSDSPNWWKVYSNGWCEQGGQTSGTLDAGSKEFNLPVEMYDNNYQTQLTSYYNESYGTAYCANYVKAKTSTKLTAEQGDNGSVLYYVVSGWISEETLLAIKNGTYTFFPGQS